MTPREIRFGIDGLTGIVVVSVAAAFASLTWTLAGYAGGASPVGAAVRSYVPPAPAPDLTAIVDFPAFGRSAAAPGAVVAPASNLVLYGVLLANPASQSTALIAPAGGDPVSYRAGEPLPGGGVVERIGVDNVLIRMGGELLILYFPDDQRTGQATAAGAVPAPAPAPAVTPIPTVVAPNSNGVEAIRSLIPPAVSGRPASPPPPAQGAAPAQNGGSGNGLIDSSRGAVTPRQ